METDATSVEPRETEDSAATVLRNTNLDDTANTSFVPPRIITPAKDVIEIVDGSGKVGKELWIPTTAIDAYLEMLSNHANSRVGRMVVRVLSSTFWEWHRSRFLFFGQREASLRSSMTTILVPRLANSNHWQLVQIDRQQKEVRLYCSLGCGMGLKDFSVSTASIIRSTEADLPMSSCAQNSLTSCSGANMERRPSGPSHNQHAHIKRTPLPVEFL